jgi:4-amino-4-deoxy-L-arabinose transferase-like glycosyltransferase
MRRESARIAAWVAWLVPFAIYCASLHGAVGYWDTGEAQTVPWIFGIMHPTGFPVFTILAGVFAHVFPFGPVSWRIALFSAIAMSAAAWLIARIIRELDGDAWIAAAAGCIFAFGNVAWTRGTRAEVHSLAVFFGVLTLYAAIRWYRTAEPRVLVGGALAWGLGIATHPIDALLLPALLLLFLARMRRVTLRTVAWAFAALLFGVAWYAYLPVRSAIVTNARLDPTRSLGLPPGKAFWDNDHPSTLSGFKKVITGSEFRAGGTFQRMLAPQTYAGAGEKFQDLMLREFTPVALIFAFGGLYALDRRDRWLSMAMLLAIVVPSAFAMAYSIETDPQRYYLLPFAAICVLAGYAGSQVVRALPPLRAATLFIFAANLIALLVLGASTFDQRNSTGAQAVISSVAKKTPGNAILIAPWLYATPLAYGAYVEHRLDRRIVISAWLAENADRVPKWMRTRPVYVVGQVFGQVPGYTLVKVRAAVPLYRVTRI